MKQTIVLLITVNLLSLVDLALTQDSGAINRSVIGSGGGQAEAGLYALDGTIGQPISGQIVSLPYDLCVGFWCGGITAFRLYLPLVLRSP